MNFTQTEKNKYHCTNICQKCQLNLLQFPEMNEQLVSLLQEAKKGIPHSMHSRDKKENYHKMENFNSQHGHLYEFHTIKDALPDEQKDHKLQQWLSPIIHPNIHIKGIIELLTKEYAVARVPYLMADCI